MKAPTLATATFEWAGATFTVQRPNVFSRMRLRHLIDALKEQAFTEMSSDDAIELLFYLANTVSVDGDPGFPVPTKNPTHADVVGYLRGFGFSDTDFLEAYEQGMARAYVASNDTDLLPPEELNEKKSAIPESSSSD